MHSTQATLTNDQFERSQQTTTEEPATPPEPEPEIDFEPAIPAVEENIEIDCSTHPATDEIDIDGMALSNPADGFPDFPHPAAITTLLDEDIPTSQSTYPQSVKDALDAIQTDEYDVLETYLVMTAAEVYEYLEQIQKKNDLHLNNFVIKDLQRRKVAHGNGMSKGAKLSTTDKQTIAEWERHRRMAERNIDTWAAYSLTKCNSGLPQSDC